MAIARRDERSVGDRAASHGLPRVKRLMRSIATTATTRDFTVATFVVRNAAVLLLFHRKLRMWLPPGGHIEPGELPDDAARREVLEETGLEVRLVGTRGLDGAAGHQLIRPEGIQVERIEPGHEHIDLIYFARPVDGAEVTSRHNKEAEDVGWYKLDAVSRLDTPPDVILWSQRAVKAVMAHR